MHVSRFWATLTVVGWLSSVINGSSIWCCIRYSSAMNFGELRRIRLVAKDRSSTRISCLVVGNELSGGTKARVSFKGER